MGEMRNAYNNLDRRPEGKRPLGRHRHRQEANIRLNLRKIGWEGWNGFIWLRIGMSGRLL
jgi:hypothetical protein